MPGNNVDGLLWVDKLPDAVGADEHEGPVPLHLDRLDLRCARDAGCFTEGVANRARHGQTGVHLPAAEDAIGDVTLKALDLASSCLDPSTLSLLRGLVVHGEILRHHLVALSSSEDHAAVPDIPDVEDTVTVHGQRGGATAEGAVIVALGLGLGTEPVRLREGARHRLLRIILEVGILDEVQRQVRLGKVRYVMAVGSMPIEDAQDADVVYSKDAKVVLVGTLRLQALLAGIANPEGRWQLLAVLGSNLVGVASLCRLL
mmetsp:Transcript_103306/g.274776  ORF Transcript_103306/g.274776 Transcript_103306/m.274776 type:complete len:259 (+) Transcript_103306:222-998(+)